MSSSYNIVCFHGFTQNSKILEKKLLKLIKSIKNINLFYLDGYVTLPKENESSNENPRAYWVYNRTDPLNITWSEHYDTNTNIYFLENSLEAFIDLSKKIGRIDGLIGFSQGGCFVDYLCKLHASEKLSLSIKFAIFISAKNFNRPGYFDDKKIYPGIKTLHIFGKIDTVIPMSASIDLSTCYPNKTVYIHDGAHIIPSSSESKKIIRSFIDSISTD